ncbi:50S ribosomal protein L22 [Candidatus Peregrinibacteria bacterium]|nr:50S ribosomal protein L22 [Candidatus Peregrinibacteria bacterium]
MKAYLHSARIAPKKANLIAKMVRGMSVPDAIESLRKTHKKAARMMELLLRSAVANASHNDKQDAQMMVIQSVVVNQGQAYRRGMPMARGRTRPYRKFLSHVSLELGFPDDRGQPKQSAESKKATKEPGNASQRSAHAVKTAGSAKARKGKAAQSADSSSSSQPS